MYLRGCFMKILVINSGSSSLKYKLINVTNKQTLVKGVCEKIGRDGLISHKTHDNKHFKSNIKVGSHKDAFHIVAKLLIDQKFGVIKKLSEIDAVGHRVVQGAGYFKEPVIITDDVLQKIEHLFPLAPLHNPAHVQAIRASQETFGASIPQVAVFDTSFHQTIPKKAYMYGLPYDIYEKYKIRKYGFHGISHQYVCIKASEIINKPLQSLKLISCHLGNGSSICAIDGGKSVDTTMGLTPLDGVLMGTRSGSIDPSCITFLIENMGYNPNEVYELINKRSGLLGISGISNDYRDIKHAADLGNERSKLAIDMLSYSIRKHIASCAVAMDSFDAIVFTGGIGENRNDLRKLVCDNLKIFGIKINNSLNDKIIQGKEGIISSRNSKVVVCVITTNEELMVAKYTSQFVQNNK